MFLFDEACRLLILVRPHSTLTKDKRIVCPPLLSELRQSILSKGDRSVLSLQSIHYKGFAFLEGMELTSVRSLGLFWMGACQVWRPGGDGRWSDRKNVRYLSGNVVGRLIGDCLREL